MATELLDLKRQAKARRVADFAIVKVNRQLVAGGRQAAMEQVFDRRFGQADRQQAILEAVVVEDVGKARRDDRSKAVIFQGPGGMLSAAARAEIASRQQDACVAISGLVQFKLRVLTTIFLKPPVEEQKLSEAGSFDPLQKLLGDDLIGINVRPVHRGDQAGMRGERFHSKDESLVDGKLRQKLNLRDRQNPAITHRQAAYRVLETGKAPNSADGSSPA